tara:strand:+ start:1027 stop:1209 length:183 start_codon:yes stop_codon:yes gene_type:complete
LEKFKILEKRFEKNIILKDSGDLLGRALSICQLEVITMPCGCCRTKKTTTKKKTPGKRKK